MKKGWRNDVGWIALHEARIFNRNMERQLVAQRAAQEKVQSLQQEYNDRQKLEIERAERHRQECHAEHELAGTLTSQRRDRPN